MLKVKIDKLVSAGQGCGRLDRREVFVWNALPGEEVEFEEAGRRGGRIEGVAQKIIKPSSHRIEPIEPDHFLSCSPWQVMSWEAENEWKKKIVLEAFSGVGNMTRQPSGSADVISDRTTEPSTENIFSSLQVVGDEQHQYHYRNKMEYSFALDDLGDINLAFFGRGGGRPAPIRECKLASLSISGTAKKIVNWLDFYPLPEDSLKSLVVRSNGAGEAIAALFLRDYFSFPGLPGLDKSLLGFQIFYSRPESPMSVPDKLIYSEGCNLLFETVRGIKLKFGLLSFFQVNIPIFEKALNDIAAFLDDKRTVVDYYSGVGAIGLSLSGGYKQGVLVDNNREAVQYAKDNIRLNDIGNCEAVFSPAENVREHIEKDRIIIFDPPRVGLHTKLIKTLLEEKPVRIIYLSCNPDSQAYDIERLLSAYSLKFMRLYNFFPRTPHVECLCVLDRK